MHSPPPERHPSSFIPPVWSGEAQQQHESCEEKRNNDGRIGACLVTENDRGLRLLFYVAGIQARDLKVDVIDDVVRISGFLSRERDALPDFSKSFFVDKRLFDISQLHASLIDGVLLVTCPFYSPSFSSPPQEEVRNSQDVQKEEIEVAFVETKVAERQDVVAEYDEESSTYDERDDRIIGMTVSFNSGSSCSGGAS